MGHKKRTIISDIFKYTLAQYSSQALGFFTAVLIRRFLGPFATGIWNILKVVIDYSSYTNLGTTSTVTYKLPIARGRGENEEANNLSKVVFNFVSITTFFCSVGIVIYALISRKVLSWEIFTGLLAVSVILLSQRVFSYYVVLLRANKDFTVLSKSIVFDAIANLSLIILIVSKFKLYGFYVVAILMPILNVFFIRRYVTYGLKFSLYFKGLFAYIKYGFPLFVAGILDEILNSIDKIMIVSMLGLEQLGFYSIALMAKSYGTGVSKNFSIVIQPYFLGDFGKNGITKSSKHVLIYSQVTAYFMAILLSLIFITAPAFILYVLPKFTPGINAMRIFLLAIFFLTISSYPNNFLVAMEKQTVLIPIVSVSILVNIFLNYIFIKSGYGISGVALATSISAFVSFFIISLYALKHSEKMIGILKFFVIVLFPLAYCFFILKVISLFSFSCSVIIDAIFKAIVFVLFSLPLIFYINRKTGIVRILTDIILQKIRRS
ncbi:MAG: polysaccharide biosynthesis C-terminal domain-containing protein [Candidatus Omnitrophota bacterium]|nr:polysaccharide biosynthesis C-terminal domain-containing protein [Candidatus Omnitrophota bacterium]